MGHQPLEPDPDHAGGGKQWPAASADAYFGARFSLYPMTGRFVPVILDALQALPEQGLEVETDDVSTFLGGHPDTVFGALEGAFAAPPVVRRARGDERPALPGLPRGGGL